MRRALTIAGSDSGGGAGIQADLKTFAAYGVFGMSALTAITAQNTVAVTAIQVLPPSLVRAQIDAVLTDLGTDVVKTGMLGSAEVVRAVVDALAAHGFTAGAAGATGAALVVDPVMIAKSGNTLLDTAAVEALRTLLLPRADLVTPNAPEAAALTGHEVHSIATAREAALRLHGLGARAVLVKGGHLPGDDVVDVLYDGRTLHELRGPRMPGPHTHGTGCTLASAIAAGLALGRPLEAAVADARAYVAGAIAHAPRLGRGHGPLDHGWRARAATTPAL
jgi:hydroxymethylpyrimidine/phosphomethylpyrimidine kinase